MGYFLNFVSVLGGQGASNIGLVENGHMFSYKDVAFTLAAVKLRLIKRLEIVHATFRTGASGSIAPLKCRVNETPELGGGGDVNADWNAGQIVIVFIFCIIPTFDNIFKKRLAYPIAYYSSECLTGMKWFDSAKTGQDSDPSQPHSIKTTQEIRNPSCPVRTPLTKCVRF